MTHKPKDDSKSTYKSRCITNSNIIKFRQNLIAIDFSYISNLQCANSAYNEFMNIYQNEFEKSFPVRTEIKKVKSIKREPWLTKGLLISPGNKIELFKIKLSNPTDLNINKYKNVNRILTKTIGKLNDKSTFPNSFLINNEQTSDKPKIAEGFNKYFSNIGHKTSQNVPPSTHTFMLYILEPVLL